MYVRACVRTYVRPCVYVGVCSCVCTCLTCDTQMHFDERNNCRTWNATPPRGAFIEQNSCFYWSASWHWLGKGRCKEAPRAKISSSIKSAGYVFPSLGRTCLCDASCRYIRCSFKSNCLWVFNLGTFWHFCVVVACLCNRLWCPQNPILDLPRVVGICAAPSTRDQSNES